MTIKERIINELRGVEFGNDFLKAVGTKWIDEMEENNDTEYILSEIKDVTNYGAATGGVSFVIWTSDNEKFIGENSSEVFEYINEVQKERGITHIFNKMTKSEFEEKKGMTIYIGGARA